MEKSIVLPLDWSQINVKIGDNGRMRCNPTWRLAPVWSDNLRDFDLWFVWAGHGSMTLIDRTIELQPGIGFWMRPGRRYVGQHDHNNCLGVSFIHFELLGSYDELPREYFEITDVATFDGMMRRVIELQLLSAQSAPGVRHRTTRATETMVKALLMDVETITLDEPERALAGLDRRITKKIMLAAAKIAEDPAHAPTIDSLSETCGYSPGHFTRLFKSLLGQSPKNYIVSMRIERAKQLLRETDQSVGDIAAILNYADAFAFSTQFKTKTGKSPSNYRVRM